MTKTNTYTILAITVAILSLFAYSFSGAAWTAPTATAPEGNTEAPINIGEDAQVKAGNFGANILAAASSTWSDLYCDGKGENCSSSIGGGETNEIVWLISPELAMPDTPVGVSRNFNLVAKGYPSNVRKVLLTGKETDVVSCSSDQGGETCTTYGTVIPFVSQTIAGKTVYSSLSGTVPDMSFWVQLKENKLSFTSVYESDITYSNPGNTMSSAEMLAYECYGKCNEVSIDPYACEVKFTYNIDGYVGERTDTVRGRGDMIIAVYNDYKNWNSAAYSMDVEVASRSWRTAWYNVDQRKVKLGYFLPGSGGNVAGLETTNLSMRPGQTAELPGSYISDYTATVISCSE